MFSVRSIIILIIGQYCIVNCNIIFNDESLYIGSICADHKNSSGVCELISDCLEIRENVESHVGGQNHKICGYNNTEQIVCCPLKELVEVKINNITDFEIPPLRDGSSYSNLRINLTMNNKHSDLNCLDSVNGFRGVKKFKHHCPELTVLKVNSEVYCDNEICSDIVCCPVDVKKLAIRKNFNKIKKKKLT